MKKKIEWNSSLICCEQQNLLDLFEQIGKLFDDNDGL